MRKLFTWFIPPKDDTDSLAHKIAQIKGEIAALTHLIDHYQAKQYNPYTVPECWHHAKNMQRLHDLKEEYSQWSRKLVTLTQRKESK